MQLDRQLSKHFRLSELTASQTAVRAGLRNEADSLQTAQLTRLAHHAEDVRAAVGNNPLLVSSGLRTFIVNGLVKGLITAEQVPLLSTRPDLVALCQRDTSAHLWGGAMDFTAPEFGTPRSIVLRLLDTALPFDQLIFEGNWVHYGMARAGAEPRREVLTAHFHNGRTTYSKGVV